MRTVYIPVSVGSKKKKQIVNLDEKGPAERQTALQNISSNFFLQKLCLLWKLLPFWLIFGKQVRAYLHGQKILHYQL